MNKENLFGWLSLILGVVVVLITLLSGYFPQNAELQRYLFFLVLICAPLGVTFSIIQLKKKTNFQAVAGLILNAIISLLIIYMTYLALFMGIK